MNDHVAATIEELTSKITIITTLRDQLIAFRSEWPHIAADVAKKVATHGQAAKKRGRTEQKARPVKPGGLLDGAVDRSAQILGLLAAHDGSMKPGDLMKAAKAASLATLRYWMAPLLTSRKVIATGTTASRRFSLPGRVPKEAP